MNYATLSLVRFRYIFFQDIITCSDGSVIDENEEATYSSYESNAKPNFNGKYFYLSFVETIIVRTVMMKVTVVVVDSE